MDYYGLFFSFSVDIVTKPSICSSESVFYAHTNIICHGRITADMHMCVCWEWAGGEGRTTYGRRLAQWSIPVTSCLSGTT
jgi:hypothetical protein